MRPRRHGAQPCALGPLPLPHLAARVRAASRRPREPHARDRHRPAHRRRRAAVHAAQAAPGARRVPRGARVGARGGRAAVGPHAAREQPGEVRRGEQRAQGRRVQARHPTSPSSSVRKRRRGGRHRCAWGVRRDGARGGKCAPAHCRAAAMKPDLRGATVLCARAAPPRAHARAAGALSGAQRLVRPLRHCPGGWPPRGRAHGAPSSGGASRVPSALLRRRACQPASLCGAAPPRR